MLKLYKFRPLGDEDSFNRAKRILETGEFWCSSLWDLNDPMEGVYTYLQSQGEILPFHKIFNSKNQTRICSFSGSPALSKPTLWGYYANGFRGIAIEIMIDEDRVKKVIYQGHSARWSSQGNHLKFQENVVSILTTKLRDWCGECEYRYLSQDGVPLQIIGKITAVYFGSPYCSTENIDEVLNHSEPQRAYSEFRMRLIKIAKKKRIACWDAGLEAYQSQWRVRLKRLP